MKKNIIASSVLIIVSIVSFYLGTTVNSLFASPKPDLYDSVEPCGAVVKDGKIYGVGYIKSSGTTNDGRFVYREAISFY